MKITDDILYVGVNDHEVDLFEGQYKVPAGMAYNSYIIADEKTAVFDTVGAPFGEEWLGNIEGALGGKSPDYLIIQHMEPDHSAYIVSFMEKYEAARIVASAKAFTMMRQFFGTDFAARQVLVNDGDTLSLGRHNLTFLTAPMVHWPEVIVTYDSTDRVLFSADGFGKFGALDVEEDWACEARRYYFGIVGKYGAQVQALLKKAENLEISTICPLHGPVLSENLAYYMDLYKTWSSYTPEDRGVFIAYASIYGNTKRAALALSEKLKREGCPRVGVCDLAREDMAEAVEDAFRHSHLVLAASTYNADVFPFMRTFIDALAERNFQNRTVALIENGSWAPMAAKKMREALSPCKNLTFTENTVQILSAPNEETDRALSALCRELCADFGKE